MFLTKAFLLIVFDSYFWLCVSNTAAFIGAVWLGFVNITSFTNFLAFPAVLSAIVGPFDLGIRKLSKEITKGHYTKKEVKPQFLLTK